MRTQSQHTQRTHNKNKRTRRATKEAYMFKGYAITISRQNSSRFEKWIRNVRMRLHREFTCYAILWFIDEAKILTRMFRIEWKMMWKRWIEVVQVDSHCFYAAQLNNHKTLHFISLCWLELLFVPEDANVAKFPFADSISFRFLWLNVE